MTVTRFFAINLLLVPFLVLSMDANKQTISVHNHTNYPIVAHVLGFCINGNGQKKEYAFESPHIPIAKDHTGELKLPTLYISALIVQTALPDIPDSMNVKSYFRDPLNAGGQSLHVKGGQSAKGRYYLKIQDMWEVFEENREKWLRIASY